MGFLTAFKNYIYSFMDLTNDTRVLCARPSAKREMNIHICRGNILEYSSFGESLSSSLSSQRKHGGFMRDKSPSWKECSQV